MNDEHGDHSSGSGCVGSGGGDSVGKQEQSDVVEPPLEPYRHEAAQFLWGYCAAVRCTRKRSESRKYCAQHEEMFAKKRKRKQEK